MQLSSIPPIQLDTNHQSGYKLTFKILAKRDGLSGILWGKNPYLGDFQFNSRVSLFYLTTIKCLRLGNLIKKGLLN